MPVDCKYFQVKKAVVITYGENSFTRKTEDHAFCNKTMELTGTKGPCLFYLKDIDPEKECMYFRKRI